MKPVRALVIALFGYAAALVPAVSQAHDVELSLPGISVRLPAPPVPIILPPGVSIHAERGGYYDREPEYRREAPPRYYREDWRHERWEAREHWEDRHHDYDRDRYYDHHDRDDHGDHDRGGWRH
jgi:hypothetical protein